MTRRLAQQSEDAAALQDMKLGRMMGKLQANRLRKQEEIAQQEVTLHSLRASDSLPTFSLDLPLLLCFIQRRVCDSVTLPEDETRIILEQHQRDMDRLHRSRKQYVSTQYCEENRRLVV